MTNKPNVPIKNTQPQPGQPQPAPAQPGQPGQESPDQDSYVIFVSQGVQLAMSVGESLKGKATVDALGNALFGIVQTVEEEGEKNGVSFSLGVISRSIEDILSHLLESAEVDIREDEIKAVVGLAVGLYIDDALKTGKMTKEGLAQLQQQAQAQVDKQGQKPGGQAGKPGPGMTPV